MRIRLPLEASLEGTEPASLPPVQTDFAGVELFLVAQFWHGRTTDITLSDLGGSTGDK